MTVVEGVLKQAYDVGKRNLEGRPELAFGYNNDGEILA
jgi:hypothetical protein